MDLQKKKMKRFLSVSGQATAEIAVFGSLILLVLGALLSYTRTIREQQLNEQNVFRQAMQDAHTHEYNFTNDDGDTFTDHGATISYSKTLDKQANLLFDPSRRSYSSSYTIFWSGAEDPPDLNKMKFNNDDVALPETKLTSCGPTGYDRCDSDATEAPDKELMPEILDVIALIAPITVSALGSFIANNFYTNGLGNYIGFGSWWVLDAGSSAVLFYVRLASYTYLITTYLIEQGHVDDIETTQEALEAEDEQMSDWGWRISTDAKDSGSTDYYGNCVSVGAAIPAGKCYVKEINAQTYDTQTGSRATNSFVERKNENSLQMINNRGTGLNDTVDRNFKLRYDITGLTNPDPTIDPAILPRVYDLLSDIALSQGLGSDFTYDKTSVGTTVNQGQIWITPQ